MGYDDYEGKSGFDYYVVISVTGLIVLLEIGLIVLGIIGIFT
jgi:hypothetical protein